MTLLGYANSWSCGDRQLVLGQEQIDQDCQHLDLAAVLGQAGQPRLLKVELLLDHSGGMFTFGADVGLGGLDQILQPCFWCVR
jgi:hypothetical protein